MKKIRGKRIYERPDFCSDMDAFHAALESEGQINIINKPISGLEGHGPDGTSRRVDLKRLVDQIADIEADGLIEISSKSNWYECAGGSSGVVEHIYLPFRRKRLKRGGENG